MAIDDKVRDLIKKAALINAVKFDGQAEAGAVLGKVLSERPDLRAVASELSKICVEIAEEVNRLSLSEQRKLVESQWPGEYLQERQKEEKALPPLPNVEAYPQVVTRFSPNPDGAIHIGSTRAIVLCHDYARIYDGRFILRFEDTDPRLHKPVLEFYDSIREDIKWLGCKWDQEVIQSDRMELYYRYAKEILKLGYAYVCTCSRSDFKRLASASQACPCRGLPTSEQLSRWAQMLDGTYAEEEAIVRIKTDLEHPNPAVRDWPALRIIDPIRYPHPRVGSRYRVWPLYNFACGIDDHELQISHIIRGKEHLTNEVRQTYMYRHFGWKYPETIHYGRLKVLGAVLSKSKMAKMIEDGVVKDFRDPRLATLAALRRRGIVPEALRHIILEVGPRPVDATLSWDNIYSYNRKAIDPIARRFFFVANPVPAEVSGVPRDYVSTPPFHPDHPEWGERTLEVKARDNRSSLIVAASDLEFISSSRVVRLMELFNIQATSVQPSKVEAQFHSESYEDARRLGAPLIHWLPSRGNVDVELVMPDATRVQGSGESSLGDCEVGEIAQLVRVGFGRIDSKATGSLVIYFGHS